MVLSMSAQENPANPRPVERPSRSIETLQPKTETAEPEKTSEVEAPRSSPQVKKEQVSKVFRVSGGDAWKAASEAGWKFFPQGARGALDGLNTTAEMHPGVVTSTVQGARMEQMFTPAQWSRWSENRFIMFADAAGRPKNLENGWSVMEVVLKGDVFEWVSRPQSGSRSPSFVIHLIGQRINRNSVVEIAGLILQGPPGAGDWREAFGPPLKP